MPNTPAVVSRRYYPRLSSIVSQDDLPEILGFVKEGLQNLFEKLHYKDLQHSKSPSGDAAFYSLSIVSDRIDIELPGTGIFLVFNPDLTGSDFTISTFPITLEYQWKILKYLNSFNIGNFSYDPKDIFEVALNILDISEESALVHFVNAFVKPDNDTITPLQQFISDMNSENSGWSTPIPLSATDITAIVDHITEQSGQLSSLVAFKSYLLENDLKETLNRVKSFFRAFLPSDINEYIKDILIPKFRVTLLLSAAIEFPRNILYPYKQNGAIWEREPENSGVMTRFYFGQMLLYADNQKGIGYNLDLIGDLSPQYSEIGNTGLLLQLQKIKIDISDKVNIPEADADGRPEDFRGVYVDALSVTLPSKWFKTGSNTNESTLRIGGYQLLIGSGGMSGIFALEAVPTQNPSNGQIIDFFSSKFDFIYPITGLINNIVTKEEESVEITNETELLDYLNSLTNKNLYSFKFPLEISPASGSNIIFNSQQEFRNYITNIVTEENGTMWINVGGEGGGFLVGFKRFDITFKQNKVISSNIKGALEIKKFVYPANTIVNGQNVGGQTVHIDIEGHLSDDGDFNLTASAEPPYPITFPDVFTYSLKSVELGKEDDDFYIGTSGTLQFEGFLRETLKLGPIEIERLRIYSDGSIEFQGGSVQLIEPIVLPLGPVEITDFSNLYREYISVETNGNHFISSGGKHYHFTLKDSLDTDFILTGAEVLFYHGTTDTEINASHSGTFRLIARRPDPEGDTNGNALQTAINTTTRVYNDTRKYLIEMYKNVNETNGSGLTFGVGIDIGGAYTTDYQRKITYKINFLSSVTSYKLGLARKVSSNVTYSTDMTTNLKNAVIELLKGHLIDSKGQAYRRLLECSYNLTTKQSNPVTITKVNNLEYLININAPPAFLNPNDIYSRTTGVTILNLTSSNPERAGFIESWSLIKKIFLKSFNISIPTFANSSLENTWLNNNMQCYVEAGITNSTDQLKLQDIIKGLFGVRGGMCWVKFRNHFHLIRKFQFGLAENYVYHLRTVYNDFYLESYYNKAINTLEGGSNGNEIKVKVNEVEKYLLASIQYNQGGISTSIKKLLRVAINSHDITKLKEIANIVAWGDANRSTRINNFIESSYRLPLIRTVYKSNLCFPF